MVDYTASTQAGPFGTQARFEFIAANERDRRELKSLGTYGFIKGATAFIVGAMGDEKKGLEDFGYLMEHVILFATDVGLGTCWLGGTFTKSSFAKKISRKEGELVPAVTSVGYIAKEPRRIEKILRRGAGGDRRLPWESLFFDRGFGAPLAHQDAREYVAPLEMVRLAPSASNKQPWRVVKDRDAWHFYLQRTPGYRDKRLVRLFTVADLQRIDMGIAMSHFELTAREVGLDGNWEICAPVADNVGELAEYTASWVS